MQIIFILGPSYNLLIRGKTLFVAKMVPNTTTIHNEKLKKGHQKFLITSIYTQRSKMWSKFDEDIHCSGSYIQ